MKHRCAIYTRKSHEEGLDQDFNSLDAQYEACKAYIVSQAGLGWALRDTRYDDGGISGGHMDRPALQALIRDIQAGLIDVIVVYKVDRLTRSLTDFAKLVDILDQHEVSFVSVTQAFNTTTSMGRLTLNVLLSFAQFEREVTAERIRDKFAASKKKGIWMGGTCPFGYRHEDRKLFIVKQEAQIIRDIYQLYIEYKNVRLVKTEIDQCGYATRLRTRKSGQTVGGKPFSRGHIYRILTNPIYIGKIRHKDKTYDGNHDPIIPAEAWSKVQSILKSNAANRQTIGNSKSRALLAGLLTNVDGERLVPHHAKTRGVRYHYYVSQRLKTGNQDSGWRLPTGTIEKTVQDTLVGTFGSSTALIELLPLQSASANELQDTLGQAIVLKNHILNCEHEALKAAYNDLIETITLRTDQLSITFRQSGLNQSLGLTLSNESNITLTVPMSIKRTGQEMRMVIGGADIIQTNPDMALIKLIARAHALRIGLENGSIPSIKEFALKHHIDHADAKRMLPLGYLATDIVEAILDGHQPESVSVSTLRIGYDLPMVWADQRRKLGFPAQT